MLGWQTKKLLELEIARDEWTVYVKPEWVVRLPSMTSRKVHPTPVD
jgi:hypothetical protein